MKFEGTLHKMQVNLQTPVQYQLNLSGSTVNLHEYLGKRLRLTSLQTIHCIHCGRKTSKSFSQGYCYPCFRSLAQCDICIVSPEKCHYDQGTCREPEWGEDNCMQDHFIYLSSTSGVKVGITRHTQLPTRWIDQGAVQALAVLKVSKRLYSGLIETVFKQFLNDKTNWRSMLKNDYAESNLLEVFNEIWPKVEQQLDEELLNDLTVIAESEKQIDISYPALSYPEKIKSFNLDKNPVIEDTLIAIKGQYLIFEQGVINVRKYAGYEVTLEIL